MNGMIALLIPVLALSIGLVAVIRMPKRAFLDKGHGDSERLDMLEEEVSRLRSELTETQERLDFTERALIRVEEQRRLDAGSKHPTPV